MHATHRIRVQTHLPTTTPPLHPAERLLSFLLAAWLVFTPLAFGTMHVPSQLISAGLAGAAFLVSLFPRVIEQTDDCATQRAAPWRLLVRLPAFWLFTALAAYLLLQALNPAWNYRASSTSWWMEKKPHLGWLPSGIDAPFQGMNSWRRLLTWLPAFFIGCAVWLGVSRRSVLKRLLLLVVGLALLISTLGIAQKTSETNSIYWRYTFRDAEVFGSFVYRNHGTAYLLLAFVVSCALAIKIYLSGEKNGKRSTPAPVMVFFSVIIAVAIFLSLSRLSTILVSLCALLICLGSTGWLARRGLARMWIPVLLIVSMSICVTLCLTKIDLTRIQSRFLNLTNGSDYDSIGVRLYASEATRKLAFDNLIFGAGSGGFRYLSPRYLSEFPIVQQETHFDGIRSSTQRFVMNESHNDILQFFAELGIVGGAILLGIAACGFAATSLPRRIAHPLGYSALVAQCVLLVYSTMDFPLQNPAVLGLAVFFVTSSARWVDLEVSVRPAFQLPTFSTRSE